MPKGGFVCDETTGSWVYQLTANADPGLNADTINVTATSPGISVINGPSLLLGTPVTVLDIAGASPGQLVSFNLCLFNKAASDSGQPYDCCKTTVTARVPNRICVKKK